MDLNKYHCNSALVRDYSVCDKLICACSNLALGTKTFSPGGTDYWYMI